MYSIIHIIIQAIMCHDGSCRCDCNMKNESLIENIIFPSFCFFLIHGLGVSICSAVCGHQLFLGQM